MRLANETQLERASRGGTWGILGLGGPSLVCQRSAGGRGRQPGRELGKDSRAAAAGANGGAGLCAAKAGDLNRELGPEGSAEGGTEPGFEDSLRLQPGTMGAAESFPATPLSKPALNKHLAHVSDPRSPTAGILRTPIEVENSPVAEPKEAEMMASEESQNWDPRSPTLGISRTPMKAVVADTINCLVKQLSEAFGAESTDQESLLEELLDQGPKLGAACAPGEEATGKTPQVEGSAEDADQEKIPTCREEMEKQPSSNTCAQPVIRPARFTDSGGKATRRKASNRVLAASSGTGRSPLSILQDDNSPSALTPRQGKRHPSLAENLGQRKEVAADLGGCAWNDLNKENRHCRLVEN
uniref:Cell division cycle associated 3 n=1 Tax=Pelusios castaneus TaxID=367368 RepID=A0A8C8RX64_9SAUR